MYQMFSEKENFWKIFKEEIKLQIIFENFQLKNSFLKKVFFFLIIH